MKKIIKKALKIIPLIELGLAAVTLIAAFFISDIPAEYSFVYKDGRIIKHSWHNSFENLTIDLAFIILVLSAILIFIRIAAKIKSKENISPKISLTLISAVFCVIMIGFSDTMVCGLWRDEDYDPQFYKFTDGQHTIVIEERSFLLYGSGTVYQIMDNNDAIIIYNFGTDDGGRNHGNYIINWHDDHAELTYNTFDLKDSKNTAKIQFIDDSAQ